MKKSILMFIALMFFSSQAFSYSLGSFVVQSNNHSNGKVGMYFNFDINKIDQLLGGTGWNNIRITAKNHDANKTSTVVLWRSRNGGSHSGHGRWNSNAGTGQWRVGDRISLFAKGKISVLSTDHADGTYGKFFNFSVDQVDRLLRNTAWTNKRFKALGNGRIGTVVLWRTPNGGSRGNGHGRWDSSPRPGQWRVNDTILIY